MLLHKSPIFAAYAVLTGDLQVLITGHSLGGALATLAAYDITRAAEEQCPIKVHCMVYTFGAPRVGNHAFARDYRHKVSFSPPSAQIWPTFMGKLAPVQQV